MFKLQVAPNTDVSGGSIPVSWCIDAETATLLAEFKVSDPQVLIVVAPANNYSSTKEYRKIVPLKDLMTYIEFHTSGLNNIWAAILVGRSNADARNIYLSRTHNQYNTHVLSLDGTSIEWVGSSSLYEHLISTSVKVDVPSAIFAKEPPQWEKQWVNHLFRSAPIDQCDYRRRRLFAYGVQPLIMFFDLWVRLASFILALAYLSRGLTFKYLLHPLTYSLSDAFDIFCNSWTITQDTEYNPEITLGYLASKFWKMVFMPWFIGFMYLAWCFHFLWIVGIAFAIIAFSVLGTLFIASQFPIMVYRAMRNFHRRREMQPSDLWYLNEPEIVSCLPDDQIRSSINSLPPKYRTIRLRFQALKAKVCRPFSA